MAQSLSVKQSLLALLLFGVVVVHVTSLRQDANDQVNEEYQSFEPAPKDGHWMPVHYKYVQEVEDMEGTLFASCNARRARRTDASSMQLRQTLTSCSMVTASRSTPVARVLGNRATNMLLRCLSTPSRKGTKRRFSGSPVSTSSPHACAPGRHAASASTPQVNVPFL
jgi:hypothetical protein